MVIIRAIKEQNLAIYISNREAKHNPNLWNCCSDAVAYNFVMRTIGDKAALHILLAFI
jgi:hypothetical protein